MEEVLQKINQKHIALTKTETQRNNVILQHIVDPLIEKMKEESKLFARMCREKYYGGSFYNGLKVGKPNEYDICLLLDIPVITGPRLRNTKVPGFVTIELQELAEFNRQRQLAAEYPLFAKTLLDGDYLSTKRVLCWMHSLMARGLNKLAPEYKSVHKKIINTPKGIFYVKLIFKQNGPAFTLNIQGRVSRQPVVIHIDLVPSIVFPKGYWSPPPIRPNPIEEKVTKSNFIIVPKRPKYARRCNFVSRHWRVSFEAQENVLIRELGHLKPALKLIKRLRDVQDFKCISSYYIKTIFLLELQTDATFWHLPLSDVFMAMLEIFKQYIQDGHIPFYWSSNQDRENNFIRDLKPATLINMSNRLKKAINFIKSHPEDPYCVIKYLEYSTNRARKTDHWKGILNI